MHEYNVEIVLISDEDCQPSRPLMADSGHDTITQSGTWTQEAHKSTMWLGTEDGWFVMQLNDKIV